MTEAEKHIQKAEEEAPPADGPTIALIDALEEMVENAKARKYHDFHKNGYNCPKLALSMHLMDINERVKQGYYDN